MRHGKKQLRYVKRNNLRFEAKWKKQCGETTIYHTNVHNLFELRISLNLHFLHILPKIPLHIYENSIKRFGQFLFCKKELNWRCISRPENCHSPLYWTYKNKCDFSALILNNANIIFANTVIKRKTVTIRPSSPWYTLEVAEEKRKRRRLERKLLKTRSQTDRDHYVYQCRVVIDLIDDLKSSYYTSTRGSLSLYSWYAWDLGQIPNMAVTGPNR